LPSRTAAIGLLARKANCIDHAPGILPPAGPGDLYDQRSIGGNSVMGEASQHFIVR
jgi:hypothetical protein